MQSKFDQNLTSFRLAERLHVFIKIQIKSTLTVFSTCFYQATPETPVFLSTDHQSFFEPSS